MPIAQGAPMQGRMGGAPPVYRPGVDPVQSKRTVVGMQSAPPAALLRPGLVQAKVQLKHGPIIGSSITSAAAKKLLDKLEDDLGCTKYGSRYKRAKELIGDPKTFEFEGFKHFSDFVHDPDDIEPPSIKVDYDLAEAVDDWAMGLGDEFKGPTICFFGIAGLCGCVLPGRDDLERDAERSDGLCRQGQAEHSKAVGTADRRNGVFVSKQYEGGGGDDQKGKIDLAGQ